MSLQGLRAADAPRIQQLCRQDRRLLLRVGALLSHQLAVTGLVLEEIDHQPAIRDLLMHPELSDCSVDDFAKLCTAAGARDLTMVADGDWRVIAIVDEVGNPFALAEEQPAEPAPGVARLLPSLAQEIRTPLEGLLKAQGDEQRGAALEQLRYAAPPLAVVQEILPLVLVDGADLVRERAINLLVSAGARGIVVDLIRAMQRGDDQQLRRLADQLGTLPADQGDLLVAAVVAAVERGQPSPGLLHLATTLAPHLAQHPAMPRLLELLIPLGSRLSLVGLIRALQRDDPDRVDAALRPLLGQGPGIDAVLIVLLARPEGPADPALRDRGLELLLRPGEEPRDRLALASALRRLGSDQDLADLLAQHQHLLRSSVDSTAYWLLAELCRAGAVDAAAANGLWQAVHAILSDVPGTQVVAILEHDLLPLLPLSAEQKQAAVPLLADLGARFRDRRSKELVQHSISGLGPAVLPALWRLIEEHPHGDIRIMAFAVLADQLLAAAERPEPAVDRLLQLLGTVGDRREQGACLLAAARLSQSPGIADPGPTQQVDAATRGRGEQAIQAWGHLAAGPHLDAERRLQIIDCLLAGITADLPDQSPVGNVDPSNDETTYVLDDRLGVHTDSLPLMLAAMERIGLSEHLPPDQLRHLVAELCRHWSRVANWEVIWGPGNAQELARVLGSLAVQDRFPGALRLQVAEALLPKITHLPIALVLGQLLTIDDPVIGDAAGRAARRLLQAATDNSYADDEQEDLSEALAHFVVSRHLGDGGDLVRRRIAGLLGSRRGQISTRTRERLRQALPELEPELAARLGWLG